MISKILVRSSADVVISADKATITGSDIEYSIEGQTLTVSQKQQYINHYSNGFVNIIGSTISGISFGNTTTSSKTTTADGEYLLSEIVLQGSGDIIIGEDCCDSSISITITGSGDVDVKRQTLDTAIVTIAGSGNIHLGTITSSFAGTIAGSGSIRGTAGPNCRVMKNVAGSGKIRL